METDRAEDLNTYIPGQKNYSDIPPLPPYLRHTRRSNLPGPPLLEDLPEPTPLSFSRCPDPDGIPLLCAHPVVSFEFSSSSGQSVAFLCTFCFRLVRVRGRESRVVLRSNQLSSFRRGGPWASLALAPGSLERVVTEYTMHSPPTPGARSTTSHDADGSGGAHQSTHDKRSRRASGSKSAQSPIPVPIRKWAGCAEGSI